MFNGNKNKTNLVIDAVMLLFLMAMAGLGLLIKYVLIPGFKRNAIYGRDTELYFMGLTRHDWGTVHLWLGFIFLSLIFIHIILHWKMICNIFRRIIPGFVSRIIIISGIGILSIILAISPLMFKPEVIPLKTQGNANKDRQDHVQNAELYFGKEKISEFTPARKNPKTQNKKYGRYTSEGIELFGYMTLNDAADKYNIPVPELTKALKVPVEACDCRIGHLNKQYGFKMSEIRETILAIKNRR